MSFKLEFETGKAAFFNDYEQEVYEPAAEVARILAGVAGSVADGSPGGTVLDINGHSVGTWSLS